MSLSVLLPAVSGTVIAVVGAMLTGAEAGGAAAVNVVRMPLQTMNVPVMVKSNKRSTKSNMQALYTSGNLCPKTSAARAL